MLDSSSEVRTPIDDARAEAISRLVTAGITTAREDVDALLAHAHNGGIEQFGQLVERRAAHEPLAHITGRARFRQLDIYVGPGAFVPRPETQSLIDWCIGALIGWPQPLIVDLASGTGVIPLCLAKARPDAFVHAVEIDAGAFGWLEHNIRENQVSVTAHHCDVNAVPHDLDGSVDMVVSNPPYVADDEIGNVDPEVRNYDPPVAIAGGSDGLDVIRSVEETARRLLRPGGLFAVEHSDRQGRSVPRLLAESGCWHDIVDHPDHLGRDRFATAVRR